MKGNSILKDQFYPERIRKSRIGDRTTHDEFASDRSRILFCMSFRRMMKKAQVFSLEGTSRRTREGYSIEGRSNTSTTVSSKMIPVRGSTPTILNLKFESLALWGDAKSVPIFALSFDNRKSDMTPSGVPFGGGVIR